MAFILESTDSTDARLLSCSLPQGASACLCVHVPVQGVRVCGGCFSLPCLLQSKPRGPVCWVQNDLREHLVGTKVRAWMRGSPPCPALKWAPH